MASKSLIVLLCVVATALAGTYPTRYDNINVDEILANDKLLTAYVDCTLQKGKCTPEGKELKSHLQDGIEHGCASCSEAQKAGTEKVIRYLIEKRIDLWEALCAKFDPTGKWRKHYEAQAKEHGIVIPN